jgi:hypothetical protein
MNCVLFDAYVETQLAPTLSKGDVVILDNLAVHKEPRGLVFVPAALFADLNLIKIAFSKLKAHLRAAARTFDDLWRAIGDI